MNTQPNATLAGMAEAGPADRESGVSHPLAKLGIGALAAGVAFLAPVLMPVVTKQDLSGVLPWLAGAEYLPFVVLVACVALWCLVVGVVVMLIEWKQSNPPGQTFFRALGLPAVIAGLVVSSQQAAVTESQEAKRAQQVRELTVEQSELRLKLLQANDVQVLPALPAELFEGPAPAAEEPPSSAPADPQGGRGSWLDQVWPGGVALAQEDKAPAAKGAPATRYAIILHRADTETAANRFIQNNKDSLKVLRLVKTPLPGGKFAFLVAYSGPLSEKEAVDKAIDLKKQGYDPVVVPLQ